MNVGASSFQNPATYALPPKPTNLLDPSDYAVWLVGILFQLVGMILLSFRGPSNGDTRSDDTFLAVGWGVFAIGTVVVLYKIFRLRKF